MSVSLTMVKHEIDAILEDLIPKGVDGIVECSFRTDEIRFWYRIGINTRHNRILLTRYDIEDNPDYVTIAVDRVCAFLNLTAPNREPGISIDPILKDLMEGRGLQDFMEDT